MAERLIQRACDRFRVDLSTEHAALVQSAGKVDEVTLAVRQIEQELAARQRLRNLGRITPFLHALERYTKAIDVACNGTPFLPWIWAPVTFVLQMVYDYSNALDKIIMAYGTIASCLPRFTQFSQAFPKDSDFQLLLAYLFEAIIEFHHKVYLMVRKPGWKVFFASAWGRFDHRFGGLIESIAHYSDQIDRNAASLDIIAATEWRDRDAEMARTREHRWQTEQLNVVLNWLGSGDQVQEERLEWLKARCYDGTSQWIIRTSKFRSWLQHGRGDPVLWMTGKPGSGKSVLCAQLITFLRADPTREVCFFLCDFRTAHQEVATLVLKTICGQLVRACPDLIPYIYDECVSKGKRPSADVMKKELPRLLQRFDNMHLVIDGLDEIPTTEQRRFVTDILRLTKEADCKILLISQDLPNISSQFSKRSQMRMSEEKTAIRKDLARIVQESLLNIDEQHNGALGEQIVNNLKTEILDKAEEMFLWVHLVLKLLENSASLWELRNQINSLPKDLADVYQRILDNICNKCSKTDIDKIRRIFSWLVMHRSSLPLLNIHVRTGMVLYPSCDTINAETKPFPNATDICKPLVESGPGGSLVFVHSTVTKFLLEHGDSPFLKAPIAEFRLAFACLSQIYQGLDLLDGEIPPHAAIDGILSGFFALFPYARVHWMSHVLKILQEESEHRPKSNDLICKKLKSICDKVVRIDPDLATYGHNTKNYTTAEKELINCLEIVISNREARIINQITGYLHRLPDKIDTLHESSEDRQQGDLSVLKEGDNNGPDPLSRVLEIHRDIVKSLSTQDKVPGFSSDMSSFKTEYVSVALTCPMAGCERAVRGFSSATQLQDHHLKHLAQLRCTEPDCSYNDVGFSTQRALKEHRRKCHGDSNVTSAPPVPMTLRRSPSRSRNELPRKLHHQVSSLTHYQDSSTLPNTPTTQSFSKKSFSGIIQLLESARKSSHNPSQPPQGGGHVEKTRRSTLPFHDNSDTDDNDMNLGLEGPSGRQRYRSRSAGSSDPSFDNPEGSMPTNNRLAVYTDDDGLTSFARLCARGDYLLAAASLQENPKVLNFKDGAENTPLHLASANGHKDIVKFLIDAGCRIDTRNNKMDTPLFNGVKYGHVDVVRLLLEAGADPNKFNADGIEPVDLVVNIDDPSSQTIRELLRAKKRMIARLELPITNVTRRNSKELMNPEINNSKDKKRDTPISDALESDHDATTPTSPVPVDSTESEGQSDGDDETMDNKSLRTLREAVVNGELEAVKRIVQIKGRFDDAEALVLAAIGGYHQIAEVLLTQGGTNPDPAPVKSLPAESSTPMLAAIGQGNLQFILLLLDQDGFDPTRHFEGEKYFEIARRRQGPQWEDEQNLLQNAYDMYRQGQDILSHKRPRAESPEGASEVQRTMTPKRHKRQVSEFSESPQRPSEE
ncbi:hypothetical protein BX600DRAFT_636 [Xylariales sp. PMI_506]|nr:hypothetical protein BX600DRAFT_636 [Xylariales sp. PMI_506]